MNKDKNKDSQKTQTKKTGFWKGLIEKIDKTMVEKANKPPCCGKDSKGGKCC